jgi:hypothetical protein
MAYSGAAGHNGGAPGQGGCSGNHCLLQMQVSKTRINKKNKFFGVVRTEMEFLNGIFNRGFWTPSQTRVYVWISTLTFSFSKMLFMNRLQFSCFVDLKPEKRMVFLAFFKIRKKIL